ncbi:bifunctional transcriptional activator/DNA repair enzyme AdaA [Ferruginivarius sediminum]|uniref:methylated-DNA--[protein]-cysteine S-methyltransferase n=1 Tax=Ferruginivarius sediminum TaxID=2661937 RepID=A0A369TCT0_9PROT|nr:methylated-DNA--[protein]-cysteine S-methyltransferase [Ferruginivarius sediminum]RDD63143.1 methylated-DNA--[protein]-cysteine S-methyltransferase [Ferruginivarius sediminum]
MSERTITTQPSAADRQLALVRRACAILEEADGERLTLAELAARLDVSPWHLQRLFRRIVGVSPRDYADARRDARFRAELRSGESVTSATYGAGYGSSSRVYEDAARRLGMTPASYAKGGAGARIAFGTIDSPLGLLIVAATDKGVCFVALGDSDEYLEHELRQEFPKADEIRRDDEAIRPALEVLLDYLTGRTPHMDLPLDVRATAFQRRVWQGLLAIPYGETRTYKQLAESLGIPKGQRAVGSACARNPVSLLVPCHRALRGDGGFGGYRWGVKRKKALLERESQGTTPPGDPASP